MPLGEETERYDIDIFDGGSVVRTLTSTEPVIAYPQADQITDFGAPQPIVEVGVAQVNAPWGRGVMARAAV